MNGHKKTRSPPPSFLISRPAEQARRKPPDEDIAHVLPLQVGPDVEPVRQCRRHILGRVDGDVQPAVAETILDLLREQALAAHFGQRPVLDAVAGGGHDLDGEGILRQRMGLHEPGTDLLRLRQGQLAATRADADGISLCHAARNAAPCLPNASKMAAGPSVLRAAVALCAARRYVGT